MGLLDFFRGSSSKLAPFQSILNIDLSALLENAFVYKVHNIDKSIEYQAPLDTLILNTFDTIRIRLRSNKKEINKNTPTILTFLLKEDMVSLKEAKFIVNSVAKWCNITDDNWIDADAIRIEQGVWRGRTFFINERMISIELNNQDGIILCITGYEEYL